jgi:hypothetical protein
MKVLQISHTEIQVDNTIYRFASRAKRSLSGIASPAAHCRSAWFPMPRLRPVLRRRDRRPRNGADRLSGPHAIRL